ncbi:IS21 family transposase [Acidovorax sp. LjRoot66]|uniref:IS21 family transposase n=1 Tax=Acidovorax sp. LjRoot66 TaxID=3342334 RepID=UPI003ED07CAD
MRIAIHMQREIARLHYYDTGNSDRAIAGIVGISPSTIGTFRRMLRKQAHEWSAIEPLDDDQWRDTLGTHNRSIAQRKPLPDWQWVHAEMQRPDATMEQLWREWRETCPEGVAYTQFAVGYRAWRSTLHVVMRRVHRPGDKLFVDFAGRTVEIRDPAGGPSLHAQIFIAVLGYSNYTFVHAVPTQTTSDWVQCHTECFEFMEGVPGWVVSDNLKAAVLRRGRDELVINPTYRDCLRHYDTAAVPTRSRRPKDKSKAEVGVQIAQRWILFRLRDRVFFSIEELNNELRQLNHALNDHPFKRLPGCRRSRFESGERPTLKPLAQKRFEMCEWRYQVRVGSDHHVEHLRCFYSVPSQLAGERVDLRINASMVEVFRAGRRVALHALLAEPGTSTTLPEHRPVAHQRVLEGEPKALMQWATSVGVSAQGMISHHLNTRSDLANGIRAARRMRDLARDHGEDRFESVCRYALPLNITSLRSITSILTNQADLRPRAATPPPRQDHDNLRGAQYFGD